MLPIDAFVEVVSFLWHYDLGGLKLATKMCSSVANHCAGAIRVFDFSDFAFYVFNSWITVCRLDSGGSNLVWEVVLWSVENLAEFISEGLRNCTVGCFYLATRRVHVRNAIKAVADTIVVADKMETDVRLFENEQALIEFVDGFRRVKHLTLWEPQLPLSFDEKRAVENFCLGQRSSGCLALVFS